MIVQSQRKPYAGPSNTEWDFDGKSVVVRSTDGADLTTIDCEGNGRPVDFGSIMGASPTVEGFRLHGGQGDLGGGVRTKHSGLRLRDCLVDANSAAIEGGGIFAQMSSSTVDGLIFGPNEAPLGQPGVIENTSVTVEGPLTVTEGMLELRSSWLDGPGYIELLLDALCLLYTSPSPRDQRGSRMPSSA